MENKEKKVYMEIPVSYIDVPEIPTRKRIDEDALIDLERSILEVGIIEPLIVARERNRYRLVAGYRRLLAAKKLNVEYVPVIIDNMTKEERLKRQLHENYGREDIPPIDEGMFFRRLLDEQGMTPKDIAECSKVSEGYIKRRLGLLDLFPCIQKLLLEEKISLEAAGEIGKINDEEEVIVLCKIVEESGASTKTIKRWVSEKLQNEKTRVDEIVKIEATPKPYEEIWKPEVTCQVCKNRIQMKKAATVWLCEECIMVSNQIHDEEPKIKTF